MKKTAIRLVLVVLCTLASTVVFFGCGSSEPASSAIEETSSGAASSGEIASGNEEAASGRGAQADTGSVINIDGVDIIEITFQMVGDTPNFMPVFSNTTDQDIDVDLSKFQILVDDTDEVSFHLTSKTVKANTPYAQNAFTASPNTMKVGDPVFVYYDGELVGTYEVGEF